LETLKIIEFIKKFGGKYYQDRYTEEELSSFIKLHLNYGTFLTLEDPQGIVAVARWNWVDNDSAIILDVIVRPDYRCIKTLKYLLDLGIKSNPSCKRIYYQRNVKGDNKFRLMNIAEIIKENK
jgi:hypothetical protein